MGADLSTTNALLGILAAVSVMEGLAVIALCVGVFLVSRRAIHLIKTIEEKQLAPAAVRVHAILDDVKDVTSKVKSHADCVDSMFRGAVNLARRFGSDAPPPDRS
jgi:hypothetical protein